MFFFFLIESWDAGVLLESEQSGTEGTEISHTLSTSTHVHRLP